MQIYFSFSSFMYPITNISLPVSSSHSPMQKYKKPRTNLLMCIRCLESSSTSCGMILSIFSTISVTYALSWWSALGVTMFACKASWSLMDLILYGNTFLQCQVWKTPWKIFSVHNGSLAEFFFGLFCSLLKLIEPLFRACCQLVHYGYQWIVAPELLLLLLFTLLVADPLSSC